MKEEKTNGGGDNGTNVKYYNVLNVAQTANPNTYKIWLWMDLHLLVPAFTTGELVQGELRIRVYLEKGASATPTNNAYQTYYMIGYRTITSGGVQGAWQAATYKTRQEFFNGGTGPVTGPGTSVGELLSVQTQAALSNYVEYVFDQPGEYFIRNSGVTQNSNGCNDPAQQCDGTFRVEWEDAIFGPAVGSPCVDC